jgi:hypothetical protein
MLREIEKTRQIAGEPRRRWFSDEVFDLIVWYADVAEAPSETGRSPSAAAPDPTGIVGFQLCYRDWPEEKALTWLKGEGFSHNRIDPGEGRPDHHKMTPILLPDGEFDAGQVREQFRTACAQIDPLVADTVCNALSHYPDPDF